MLSSYKELNRDKLILIEKIIFSFLLYWIHKILNLKFNKFKIDIDIFKILF